MSWLTRSLSSSSGRKLLVALTGLALVLFLIIHLLDNLMMFGGRAAFNDFADSLHAGPLIVIGDVGLSIVFPIHIALVIWLALDNKKARGGIGYKVQGSKQTRGFTAVLASKWALYGGLLLLGFLVIHVWQFRLHHEPNHAWEMVTGALRQPGWGLLYIVGSLVAGWHIFHGFQAAFRSLGVNHPRYTPMFIAIGAGLSVVLALGFAFIPVWLLLGGGN